jgi:hypothetical protein
MKNVVNCQHLLFTETWRHSKFGSRLCKIRWEKYPIAFVKVVEGSEIYNFPIHHFVHFYSTFWRNSRSNGASWDSSTRRRDVAPAPRLPRRPSPAARLPKAPCAFPRPLKSPPPTWCSRTRRTAAPPMDRRSAPCLPATGAPADAPPYRDIEAKAWSRKRSPVYKWHRPSSLAPEPLPLLLAPPPATMVAARWTPPSTQFRHRPTPSGPSPAPLEPPAPRVVVAKPQSHRSGCPSGQRCPPPPRLLADAIPAPSPASNRRVVSP